jgi:hypothetical protein
MKNIEELVCSRIRAMPKDLRISISPMGTYSPEEILGHIRNKDEVGKKVIEIESYYLKSLKKGNYE